MGRFLLGSTVIVLLPPPGAPFPDDWTRGRPVRLGEAMTAGPAPGGANP
jgi:phosphatidylserine decarboxylase